MAAGDKIIALLLKLDTDEASRRRTEQRLGSVRELLDKTAKSTLSIDQAGEKVNAQFAEFAREQAIDAISADAVRAAQETGDWAVALERVAQNLSEIGASDSEIQRVTRALRDAQSAQGSGGGGGRRGGGQLDTVDRLGSVGSQLLSGLGQGELANVAGIVGDVADGIGSLGVAGVATAGALAIVSVAMSEYNRQLEQQRASLSGALDAQGRYYTALQTLTSEQAQSEIERENERLGYLRQQRAETQGAIDSAFAQAQAQFGDAIARGLDASGQLPTAQLRERLGELDTQITSTEGYAVRLTQGLANNAFALNDADEAARALAESERRIADARKAAADQQIAEEIDNAQLMRGSSDAVRDRIQSIKDEIGALNTLTENMGLTDDQVLAYTNRQIDLIEQYAELDGEILPYVEGLEREQKAKEALTQQTDDYFDALEREGDARTKVTKAQEDLNDAYKEAAAKAADNAAEGEARRNEVVQEGADRRAEIERRSQEALRKLVRDYERSRFKAVAERDALEARLAKIARDDGVEDQKYADDEAQRQQDEAQAKQLRSLDQSLRKQADQLNAALAREVSVKQTALYRQQVDLANAESASAAIRSTAISGRIIQEETAYQTMLFNTEYWMSAIVTRFGQGLADMYAQMARGGVVEGSPAAWDLYGMAFGGGGQTRAIRRAVDYRLNQYFQAAGITER